MEIAIIVGLVAFVGLAVDRWMMKKGGGKHGGDGPGDR